VPGLVLCDVDGPELVCVLGVCGLVLLVLCAVDDGAVDGARLPGFSVGDVRDDVVASAVAVVVVEAEVLVPADGLVAVDGLADVGAVTFGAASSGSVAFGTDTSDPAPTGSARNGSLTTGLVPGYIGRPGSTMNDVAGAGIVTDSLGDVFDGVPGDTDGAGSVLLGVCAE
jgi:hypothetical protein